MNDKITFEFDIVFIIFLAVGSNDRMPLWNIFLENWKSTKWSRDQDILKHFFTIMIWPVCEFVLVDRLGKFHI